MKIFNLKNSQSRELPQINNFIHCIFAENYASQNVYRRLFIIGGV